MHTKSYISRARASKTLANVKKVKSVNLTSPGSCLSVLTKEKVAFIQSMGLQTFKSVRPLTPFISKLCLLSNFVGEFNTHIFNAIMTGTIEMFVKGLLWDLKSP